MLTLMTIRSSAAARAFIASVMGTSHGDLGPGLGMVLRAWMRFSSHLPVSASEYRSCYPDLTHGKPPRRISYNLTWCSGKDQRFGGAGMMTSSMVNSGIKKRCSRERRYAVYGGIYTALYSGIMKF